MRVCIKTAVTTMEGPEISMRIRVRALTHGKCVRIENSGPSIVVTAVLIHTRTTHCSKNILLGNPLSSKSLILHKNKFALGRPSHITRNWPVHFKWCTLYQLHTHAASNIASAYTVFSLDCFKGPQSGPCLR